jgi:hypothetical protein
MKNIQHLSYLAKVIFADAQSIVAEFNRNLHLPLPAFGTLVKIDCTNCWVYGLIADARLKGESQAQNQEFFENPVPTDTEIHILPVGYLFKEKSSTLPVQEMPPEMPSNGEYVFMPNEEELQLFTIDLGFLKILLTHPAPMAEGLIVTTIRKFSSVYPDPQSFFIRVTQELSRLTHNNRDIVQRILSRTKSPTFNGVSR